jgi:hypothetical protein
MSEPTILINSAYPGFELRCEPAQLVHREREGWTPRDSGQDLPGNPAGEQSGDGSADASETQE